jgi:hypothetical protein
MVEQSEDEVERVSLPLKKGLLFSSSDMSSPSVIDSLVPAVTAANLQ